MATYTYDSFGNLAASTGTVTDVLRFTAREIDAETAMHFYRARYYVASMGRFASEDPIGFTAGENFYRYVANNPPNLVDPTGLQANKQQAKPECCPTAEEKRILEMADDTRDNLRQLRETGTIVAKAGKAPLGATICVGRSPVIHITINPKEEPCIYKCIMEHEQVHARACRMFGPRPFLTEDERETPAYTRELGCYLRMLLENGLGPYRPYRQSGR